MLQDTKDPLTERTQDKLIVLEQPNLTNCLRRQEKRLSNTLRIKTK